MPRLPVPAIVTRVTLCLMTAVALMLPPASISAQVQDGATLTILRGQVAVVHADGSAVQPASSGVTVQAGDEIRTISRSGALITFFSGTEIELGEDTILALEQVSKQGDKVDISLRQVLGATVNRVQSIAGAGSTYQIQAGGAVALVRGTTFSMVGPVTTSSGNIVTVACLADCTPASTFSGCPMGPYSGLGVTVSGGKVESACQSFAVGRTEGLFDAATQAVTTVEQAIQGDTNGVPAGQVSAGSRQETDAKFDAQQREAQQKDQKPNEDPVRPPSPPTSGPPRPCNSTTTSGGFGETLTVHELGQSSGTFSFFYQAFSIPDSFEVIYQGNTLLNTGFVSGSNTVQIPYGGTATIVTVIVKGSQPGTAWDYIVGCPSSST